MKKFLMFIILTTMLFAKPYYFYIEGDKFTTSQQEVKNKTPEYQKCLQQILKFGKIKAEKQIQIRTSSIYRAIMLANQYGTAVIVNNKNLKNKYKYAMQNLILLEEYFFKVNNIKYYIYINKTNIKLINKLTDYLRGRNEKSSTQYD